MPKVKQIGSGSVAASSLPDSRLNVSVNAEQFGAGIGNGITDIGKHAARMKEEDDAIAATDAFNEASEQARVFLYDGDEAIYSQQGKNAVGAHDKTKEYMEGVLGQYSSGLENEGQRRAFKSMWGRRTNTNLDSVARYEAGQRKIYFDDTHNTMIEGAINNAANNFDKPGEVESSLNEVETVIRSNPQGYSEEVVLQKQAAARSSIHKSVVDRMMINDPDGARQYYEDHKDSIDGEHHKQIEAALKGNKQKKQAQDNADRILAMEGKTDQELRAEAKKEKNADVRSMTETLVAQDIARRKEDEREFNRQMSESFWVDFFKNPDVRNIPDNLPIDEKLKAKKYALNPTRKTDLKAWNEINQLAINDPEKFKKTNLYKFVTDLDESDFQEFGRLQRSINKGDKVAYDHLRTPYMKMKSALKNIGVKEGADDFALFQRLMQQQLLVINNDTGKKATPDQVDKIIDTLMIEGEVPGTLYDPDKRLFQVKPGERFFIEDVPATFRKGIIESFKKIKGREPTEEEIVDKYTLHRIKQ